MDKIRKANRDHACAGCSSIIEKGKQYHHRHPKDYHAECLPKAELPPVTETQVEPATETGAEPVPVTNVEPEIDPPQEPKAPVRGANGRFIRKAI